MKRVIVIFIALLVLIVGFLGTLYYLVMRSALKEPEEGTAAQTSIMGLFFKNPETVNPTTPIITTTTSGGTFIQIGNEQITTEALTEIPTSIVYVASEAPDKVVMTIESVGKTDKGTVLIMLNIFTLEASKMTSVNPSDFLAVIPPEGNEVRPSFIQGSFTNMAPGGSYQGNAVFTVPAGRNSIILQVGRNEDVVFFEFDFSNKTFRQIEIS